MMSQLQWVRTEDGGLLNLLCVSSIYLRRRESIKDNRYDVLAFLAGGGGVRLFTGPLTECERYLADLAKRMEVIR